MKYYLILLLFISTTVFGASSRTVDADKIRSSDHSKTWTMPNATGTVSCVACTETLTNKTIDGSQISNSITSAIWAGTTVAINHGGTGVTSLTTTPASGWAAWDASSNLSANNHFFAYATTVSSATPITLVVGSAALQNVTGSTAQQLNLPVAATLGSTYVWSATIVNQSSNTTTVKTSGGNTIQAMAANTQLNVTCINPSGGTGTASWNWTYQAIQNSLGGGGTVTSVTFTGDGTVFSSTPSSAVTASGTLTAALATQTARTFLQGPQNGSAATPTFAALKAPTVTQLTSTGSTVGYIFTVTSANATVGATYTNNGHTYTVLATISAGTLLWASQAASPSASGTLTKSGGTGDATITFSLTQPYATYTAPTNPAPLYLEVELVGGGGGGTGGGTSSSTTGGAGSISAFGTSVLIANGGSNVSLGLAPILGGTVTVNSPAATIVAVQGTSGASGSAGSGGANGGLGGVSPFGGAGGGGDNNEAGVAAAANSGSGGGGGGASGTFGGGGGSAGGYIKAIVPIQTTFTYAVAGGGVGGGGGTGGQTGANGGTGLIIIKEFYQ